MAYLLAAIPPLPLAGDPLTGIVVGGSAGLVTVFLGAALLGSVLNALRQRPAGHRSRFQAHGHMAADCDFREAA
jgi:hypothetical protein